MNCFLDNIGKWFSKKKEMFAQLPKTIDEINTVTKPMKISKLPMQEIQKRIEPKTSPHSNIIRIIHLIFP